MRKAISMAIKLQSTQKAPCYTVGKTSFLVLEQFAIGIEICLWPLTMFN